MKICFYDGFDSDFDFANEIASLFPNLLIADHLFYFSSISYTFYFYLNAMELCDELAMDIYEDSYELNENNQNNLDKVRENFHFIKKITHKKNRNKQELIYLGRMRKYFDFIKNDIRRYYESCINDSFLTSLLPFIEDGSFEIKSYGTQINDFNRDEIMLHITKSIIDLEDVISIDDGIESYYDQVTLDEMDEVDDFEVVNIQLWEFPQLHRLSSTQLKYTRDNLKPVLEPFKKDLKELQHELINIPFGFENTEKIKQICINRLYKHIEPIQKCIDESLYIIKIKNEFPYEPKNTFCIGVLSILTLIELYVETEVITDEMGIEIKAEVAHHHDLDSSYFYCFCKTPEIDRSGRTAKPTFEL
ncbi:MAG: hypothetical protein WCH34_17575 [Bacteroidota bacterium]